MYLLHHLPLLLCLRLEQRHQLLHLRGLEPFEKYSTPRGWNLLVPWRLFVFKTQHPLGYSWKFEKVDRTKFEKVDREMSHKRKRLQTMSVRQNKLEYSGEIVVDDRICMALRRVQRESGCTTKTLQLVLQHLQPFLKCDDGTFNFSRADRLMFELSGTTVLKLNGCVGCDRHVYAPADTDVRCPTSTLQRPRPA